MSAGTFGPPITLNRIQLAKTSVANTSKKGGQVVVTMRGANGVGDNQKLQMIAEALGRGEVMASDIDA